MAKSLFISYDGLTDPLGQSQILPYMIGLNNLGHRISILSCEKPERYFKNKKLIEKICLTNQIQWIPIPFHTKPPILSKYYDLHKLTAMATKLQKKENFEIIHCRSYLSADIGLKLKRKFGVKYLFDMRGFWVDERVDGGLWNTKSFFYRTAYKKWKQKEAELIHHADYIISLTEAGKREIQTWTSYFSTPIEVIPCSADMELFSFSDKEQKKEARKLLQIDDETFVLSYLGSLGTWYLLDEMLLFFKFLKENFPVVKFLILTPDDAEKVYQQAFSIGLDKNDFVIQFAQRKEVPQLMKASDVSISFIKPAYSKIASSPTKLGELLSMGIPVICNNIGDVAYIIDMSNGGFILNDFSEISFRFALEYIHSLKYNLKINIESVRNYYSLEQAIIKYDNVYKKIFSTCSE